MEPAIDFLTLMDHVKSKVEIILKQNLYNIKDTNITPEPTIDFVQVGKAIRKETSNNAYERIRLDIKQIPSIYKMRREITHKVVPIEINIEVDKEREKDEEVVFVNDDNTMTEETNMLISPLFDVSSTVYGDITFEDAMQQFSEKETTDDAKIYGAKIIGEYENYMEILKNNLQLKIEKTGDSNVVTNEVIIDSYDGAVHSARDSGETCVISFSSKILDYNSLIKNITTPASSLDLLTWCQYCGKENAENLFPILYSIQKEKQAFLKRNPHITLYEVHDGKMLYTLSQHVSFNRKYHPFLLCKCKRGECYKDNNNNECVIMDQDEHTNLYNKSKKYW